MVDCLKTLDEIADLGTGGGTTGGSAKMRATAEWTPCVNPATSGGGVQQGATAIGGCGYVLASGSSPGASRHQGFATGKIRSSTREFEAAAIGDTGAVAGQRSGFPLGVDLSNLAGRLVKIRLGFHPTEESKAADGRRFTQRFKSVK
jgi:hypothetical protein